MDFIVRLRFKFGESWVGPSSFPRLNRKPPQMRYKCATNLSVSHFIRFHYGMRFAFHVQVVLVLRAVPDMTFACTTPSYTTSPLKKDRRTWLPVAVQLP